MGCQLGDLAFQAASGAPCVAAASLGQVHLGVPGLGDDGHKNRDIRDGYPRCSMYSILPTFGSFMGQMLVNIPYMEHMVMDD